MVALLIKPLSTYMQCVCAPILRSPLQVLLWPLISLKTLGFSLDISPGLGHSSKTLSRHEKIFPSKVLSNVWKWPSSDHLCGCRNCQRYNVVWWYRGAIQVESERGRNLALLRASETGTSHTLWFSASGRVQAINSALGHSSETLSGHDELFPSKVLSNVWK